MLTGLHVFYVFDQFYEQYFKITQIEENNGTALYDIRMERICLGCLYSYQYIFPIEPFPHTCIQCISCCQIGIQSEVYSATIVSSMRCFPAI